MTIGDEEANRLVVAALRDFLAGGAGRMPERLGPPRDRAARSSAWRSSASG